MGRLAMLLFVVGLVGCGGGGGGVDADADAQPTGFLGDYHYTAISFGQGESSQALWGTFTADGNGMVGGSLTLNNDGTSIGPFPVSPFPYDTDAGRRTTLASSGLTLEGGITAEGDALALATTGAGDAPSVAILARREGSFSDASLDGTYHVAGVVASGDVVTYWGTVVFNGKGSTTVDVGFNNEGLPALGQGTGPYSVAKDGTLAWSPDDVQAVGGVLAGGDLVVLTQVTGDNPLFWVLIRAGASASTATLSGAYHYVRIQGDLAGGGVSGTGTASADGAGLLSIGGSEVVNTNGTITTASPLQKLFRYTVASDGTLSISAPDTFVGGVSPDGRFAVFSGSTTDGNPPSLYILHR